MDDWITAREASKDFKIRTNTLITWAKEGKIKSFQAKSGRHFYDRKSLQDYFNLPNPSNKKENQREFQREKLCYCRVSSRKQLGDLERQKEHFKTSYPSHSIVTDVGSGINWKRKGLLTILDRAMSGMVEEVVVAHRDRLSRIGFELLKWLFERTNTRLIVEDADSGKSRVQELSEDLMSIVTIYACREMGRRRYESKKDKIEDESESETDD